MGIASVGVVEWLPSQSETTIRKGIKMDIQKDTSRDTAAEVLQIVIGMGGAQREGGIIGIILWSECQTIPMQIAGDMLWSIS